MVDSQVPSSDRFSDLCYTIWGVPKKSEERGRRGHYLGPAPSFFSGTCRVSDLGTGTVVTARDLSIAPPVLSPELRDERCPEDLSTEHERSGKRRGRKRHNYCRCRCSVTLESMATAETSSSDSDGTLLAAATRSIGMVKQW